MPTVRVIAGPDQGRSLELDREIVVGRSEGDLTIEDSELSRRHAALRPVAGGVEIEDLGSTNGTFVDGSRIAAAVTLTRSGRVQLGGTELAVEIEAPAPAAAAAPAPAGPAVAAPTDVTAPRPVVTPAQAEAAAVPPGPGLGTPPGGGPPSRRPPPVGPILAALVAIGVLVVAVVASGSEPAKTRKVDVLIKDTFLRFDEPTRIETVTGVASGPPFGQGSTRLFNTYPVPLARALPGPTSVTDRFTFLFNDGVAFGTMRFTLVGAGGKNSSFKGTLRFTGGTRRYKGAKGSGTVSGTINGAAIPPRSVILVRGEVKY